MEQNSTRRNYCYTYNPVFQASLTVKQAYSVMQCIASVNQRQRAAEYVSAHNDHYTFTAAVEANTAIIR